MLRPLLSFLAVCSACVAAEPKVIHCASREDALMRANAYAVATGGRVIRAGFTGSMKPTLRGGEYGVAVLDFASLERRDLALNGIVLHRVRGAVHTGLRGIWTTRGDANPKDDPLPLTASTYRGTVKAIFKSP